MQTFGVELLTVLGNAVFAPIARNGRPLAVVSGEANAYVDRAVSLVTRLNADADCNGIRLVVFCLFAKAALWVLVFILALLDGK